MDQQLRIISLILASSWLTFPLINLFMNSLLFISAHSFNSFQNSNPMSCLFSQDEGLFPDPFDCTSYHNCISDQNGGFKDFRYSCRLGLAYDPLSTICRLKRSDRVCTESPVPKCEKPLQMGALIENPTIYYICVDSGEGLYPRLYRCSNGLMFDAINAQCVESLPTTTPKPKVEFKCTKSGVFPDPYDCHSYYVCDNDLRSSHKTCRVGFYFDQKINLCALGFC